MNAITKVLNSFNPFILATVVFGVFILTVNSVHAQEFDTYTPSYGFDTYTPSYGFDTHSSAYSFDTYTPGYNFDTYTPSYAFDTYTPGSTFDTYTPGGTFDTYTPPSTFDTYTPPDTYAAYSTPSYSNYSSPYSYGAYAAYAPSYMPYASASYGYSYPSYSYPVASYPIAAPSQGNTTVVTNDNDATCTTPNSCNTIIDDHSVVNANTTISSPTTISYNNAAPSQPIYYPTLSYPTYPTYPTYNQPTCYITITPSVATRGQAVTITWSAVNATYGTISEIGAVPMSGSRTIYAYQNMTYTGNFSGPGGSTNCYVTLSLTGQSAPYVTLSQVPYTGLELGPTATALYWLFLLLWCAIGAYLIAVKKVHNYALAWVGKVLVGDQKAVSHPAYHSAARVHTTPTATREHAQSDAPDSFIMDQINRNSR